ncbi:MAG: ferric reductase-like transmembrane domain-containing protein [Sulfitobacter sp.]
MSLRAVRRGLAWGALVLVVLVPVAVAATSPLLAWRDPIYILAGFAGIFAATLLVVQPLLAQGKMPGVHLIQARRLHRWVGMLLVLAVIVHIVGLWITSPPDVIDVLLFRAPTLFSIWGAIAMWAVLGTAFLAVTRKKLRLRPRVWRLIHLALAVVIAGCTLAHAAPIQGTMGPISKYLLGALIVIAVGQLFLSSRKNRSGPST